jgi:uncharacterized protein with HEPN domain
MMHPKSPKWLHDIVEACELIQSATQGRALADYEQDRLLRSAIERNFEIIGEALNRLHDYVDHSRVWQIIQSDVPRLRAQVEQLLKEAE